MKGCLIALAVALAQWPVLAAEVAVNFDKPLQDWDGFGVNYVEASQTRDYAKWPQDYGGFSTLSETKRQEIIQAIFGEDGLKPGIVKMFLDSLHEGMDKRGNDNDDPMRINLAGYDHERTTGNMRSFVREGLKRTRAGGRDLVIIATMYGPPPWTTRQKIVRGRDMDPAEKREAAEYLASWAKFLKEKEGFPVKYVSLHNEGEARNCWPADGTDNPDHAKHDYNMYWPPEQVVEFLTLVRDVLDKNGLQDVGVTPGEPSHWELFTPYAEAIANNAAALKNIALITSHGFRDATYGPFVVLQKKRPELHAWTTSATWGKMTYDWLDRMRGQIYNARINAFIPWAAVQRHSQWVGGDPNPGTAFYVDDKGNYEIRRGYYQYKQICPAGQPGMKVATVSSSDANVSLMAFASNGTKNPDAFVVFNKSQNPADLNIAVTGTKSTKFSMTRTIMDEKNVENCVKHDDVEVRGGKIEYKAPALSITTFYGK